ncbi:4-oxalocrotonate tautomerase [Pseudoalteromonas luteoviolacea]|uniref:4-oxalocrotonate tautomerase n=1 Tax=Pseudoalteromonas luteoviolacea TaxID=43657 RepID=A0A1C0TWX2_9GAMM|nr:4-oxalocrotonate tautomerase [Pseudoalteromonas luteoviolacea]OCQ23825.1 4-oxalocrotonate tautomerase [Pseudoalteromonas luteoviolacea]
MPLTLTLTEGVLPQGTENLAIAKITDAMLKWHNLTGNETMKSNITAMIQVLPKSATYAGGKEFSGVWVEWKVPSFAFTDRDVQIGFGQDVTNIIYELSERTQPRENIYINVVHAVDGSWNFNGIAMTNEQITQAIAAN